MKKVLFVLGMGVMVLMFRDGASAITDAGNVLGFEVPADWTTTTAGVSLGSSPTHTQGTSSLAVTPSQSNGWTPLFSVPLSTLSSVSGTVAIDLMLPSQQANPSWLGAVQVYINCPSHNIYTAYLSETELTGMPLGVWNTLTFPVPTSLLTNLLASGYSDLTFEVVLNVQVPTTGIYLFDNLRFVPVSSNACVGMPNGTSCSDGNACTLVDSCQNGICVGTNILNCDDDNPCTVDSCDVTLGCMHSASSCALRSGQIEAESFDASDSVAASPTCVSATAAGAWVQFNNVDFGASGTSGRFEISLIGAPGNQNIELHLDSPTGPLVADLLSFPSAPAAPVPQAIDFQLPESGVHTVVVVFDAPNSGCLDWFTLTKARGSDTVADFPPSFHHTNPGAPIILTNPPLSDDEPSENDVPPYKLFTPTAAIDLAPNGTFMIPVQYAQPSFVIGQARWSGAPGPIQVSFIDTQGNLLGSGGTSSVPGGFQSNATLLLSAAQEVVIAFTNTGSVTLTGVQLYAGGAE